MPRRRQAKGRQPPAREILLVGSNQGRLARMSYALDRYGFDVKSVVCRVTSANFKVPHLTPRVIVADAPPPVTARHVRLIQQLRAQWERVPLIAVTVSDDPSILTGFLALGVDEFCPYASRPAELVVRIRWQLARGYSGYAGDHIGGQVGFGGVKHKLVVRGTTVPLTVRELALYSCLAARLGQVVSRDDIERAVWGGHSKSRPPAGGVEVYVFHLRKKLAKLGLKKALRTVRGVGYSLVEEALVS